MEGEVGRGVHVHGARCKSLLELVHAHRLVLGRARFDHLHTREDVHELGRRQEGVCEAKILHHTQEVVDGKGSAGLGCGVHFEHARHLRKARVPQLHHLLTLDLLAELEVVQPVAVHVDVLLNHVAQHVWRPCIPNVPRILLLPLLRKQRTHSHKTLLKVHGPHASILPSCNIRQCILVGLFGDLHQARHRVLCVAQELPELIEVHSVEALQVHYPLRRHLWRVRHNFVRVL
mmetsp:Transcript_11241/g.27583  ORF Transcript_11241/g.27583 Transcript_11241/m.27583 type:complete len:232 (+) Transcript_11241:115-810(+)